MFAAAITVKRCIIHNHETTESQPGNRVSVVLEPSRDQRGEPDDDASDRQCLMNQRIAQPGESE